MNIKNGVISTTHKENTKFQCLSRGQIVVIGSKFYASNIIGKKVTPEIHVYANGELIPTKHYKITYKGATHTGVATIKVSGTKEKYVGTLSTTFNLLPRLSKLTKWSRSKNKKKIKLQWSAQTYASGYTIWYSSDKKMIKDSHKITIKGGKHNMGTFSRLAQNTILGKFHIIEDEFTRVGGTPHHFVVHRCLSEAFPFVLDQQSRKLRFAIFFSRNSLHSSTQADGCRTVGDKNLGTIEMPKRAVKLGGRLSAS
jgi:hypothetical protein